MTNTPGKATYNVLEKGLPDIPAQKNKRVCKDAGHAARHINISVWLWEILSLMMSMSCVVAILAILDHYNQQPVPNWSYGFTLNSVVSILAVVARSSLILPIAEAISQLKWSWFWRGHRLVMDFERFDSASRGPWGSLVLLSHPRSWNFAAVGAALTITSFVVEPSLQQIPSYLPMLVRSGGSATVSRSTHYYDVEHDTSGKGIMSSLLKASVYSGIFAAYNGSMPKIAPTCSTGNCTWPAYNSLGVCSKCENITSLLTYESQPWWTVAPGEAISGWKLPNGVDLTNNTRNGDPPDWMVSMTGFTSLKFQNMANQSLNDVMYVYVPPAENISIAYQHPQAFECLLWFCVKTYEGRMENGVFNEEVTASWPGPNFTLPFPSNIGLWSLESCNQEAGYDPTIVPGGNGSTLAPCALNATSQNYTLHPPGSPVSYSVNVETFNMLRYWMSSVLDISLTTNPGDVPPNEPLLLDLPQAFYDSQEPNLSSSTNYFNQTLDMEGPDSIFERIAESMTFRIRSIGDPAEAAAGVAYNVETTVHARWVWATFPIALIVLTSCFLFVTVMLSVRQRIPMWKSSSLAGLLHGLDEETCEAIPSLKVSDIEHNAEQYTMKMERLSGRWTLEGKQKHRNA